MEKKPAPPPGSGHIEPAELMTFFSALFERSEDELKGLLVRVLKSIKLEIAEQEGGLEFLEGRAPTELNFGECWLYYCWNDAHRCSSYITTLSKI